MTQTLLFQGIREREDTAIRDGEKIKLRLAVGSVVLRACLESAHQGNVRCRVAALKAMTMMDHPESAWPALFAQIDAMSHTRNALGEYGSLSPEDAKRLEGFIG